MAGFAGLLIAKEVPGLVSSVPDVGHLCPGFFGLNPLWGALRVLVADCQSAVGLWNCGLQSV